MFDPEKPPELSVTRWVNANEPFTLAGLRGRVVVVLAFQILCPACVQHSLPQASRLARRFNPEQVMILGLHSVFENHAKMQPAALEAFLAEKPLPFPVAIDTPQDSDPPVTMTAYQMQGTPTVLIFDREGRLRRHYFGQPDDILLGAEIMAMATEEKGAPRGEAARIERKLAATLTIAQHDHGHDHEHGDHCGCDHDHGHDHHHHHHHHGHDHHHHGHSHGASDRHGDADRMTEPPRDRRS
jgi:thiol-disulfide isomerase/thioredoxin